MTNGVAARPTEFGRWLRAERDARKWTADDLSDASGVSQPMISHLERGARNATRKMVRRLCAAFQLPPAHALRLAGFTPAPEDEDPHSGYDDGTPPHPSARIDPDKWNRLSEQARRTFNRRYEILSLEIENEIEPDGRRWPNGAEGQTAEEVAA